MQELLKLGTSLKAAILAALTRKGPCVHLYVKHAGWKDFKKLESFLFFSFLPEP
jgi:hypothetical protein